MACHLIRYCLCCADGLAMETTTLTISRRVAISLMAAAALVSAPLSYASPALVVQAPAPQSSGNQPDVKALVERAGKLQAEGKYGEAAAIWRQILAIEEKSLGPDHPEVAIRLNNLAGLLREQGQYAAAEPLYLRSLEMLEKALGPNHLFLAASLNNLAGLLRVQGQYAAAEPLHRRSLAIKEKALGPDHPDVANSLKEALTNRPSYTQKRLNCSI